MMEVVPAGFKTVGSYIIVIKIIYFCDWEKDEPVWPGYQLGYQSYNLMPMVFTYVSIAKGKL